MSTRHLTCPACRIRVRADAREIAVLEGRCPICGAMLRAASPASSVVGFRSFDLDSLSEQVSDDQPYSPGGPADFPVAAKRVHVAGQADRPSLVL